MAVLAALGAGVATSSGGAQTAAQQSPGLVAPGPNRCLVGSGTSSWCGDGRPATRAKLGHPNDVAVAPDGSLVIADTGNNVIRRVGTDGVIGTVAGDGSRARRRVVRALEPAAHPRFSEPTGVSVAPDGSVLVADSGNNAIRRIRGDGMVEIVMGGPGRVMAKLTRPQDVLALPNGDILVADTFGHRVLKLTAAGAVELVAGNGDTGFPVDGVPATQSPLYLPVQIASMPGGNLLIADTGRAAVRIVGPNGLINTIVRTGDSLEGVAWTPDHGVVYSRSLVVGRDRNTRSAILRSDPMGGPSIRIAGTGKDGFSGDIGLGTDLAVSFPRQLAVAPDGALLVAEAGNDRIRSLAADGGLTTLAGSDRPTLVASVVPDDGGQNAEDPGPGCYGRHPRFEVFNFLPGDSETLEGGRRQVTVRLQTSVNARVQVALKQRKDVLRRRVLERVSNARVATIVKLRAQLSEGTRYVVVMNGRSLDDPDIKRCDRRWVRVK
jgi:hypothetical protein